MLHLEKFSFIINQATDLSTSKQLAILATYFDMDAFQTKHYLVDTVKVEAGTAKAIYSSVQNTSPEVFIPMENIIGYLSDTTNVILGERECANSEMHVQLIPFSFFLCRKNFAKEFRRIMLGHICTLPPFIKNTRCLQRVPKSLRC